MSWSGTVTCSYCYRQGHNRRKCPELTARIKSQYDAHIANAKESRAGGNESDAKWYEKRAEEKRQDYIKRAKIDPATGEKVTNKAAKAARMKSVTCGYCGDSGHTRRVCPVVKRDKMVYVEQTRRERKAAFEDAANMGIGVGSMLPIRASGYDKDGQWRMMTQLRYIKSIDWDNCVANRSTLAAFHVDATKLGVAGGTSTSRDGLGNLVKALGECRDHARATEAKKPPVASLIPHLEPPTGWFTPTEQSIKEAIQREFPTTGNQHNKSRKYYYYYPEAHLQEIIKDLGLEEHYRTS